MFIVIKKFRLALIGAAFVLAVSGIVFLCSAAPDEKSYKIIIDAGHGEPDGGAVGADGTTFRSGKFPDFICGSAVRTGKLFCFHYAGSFFISCDKTKYSPVFRECKLYRLIFRKKRLYYLQISERNSADECKRTDEERKNLLLHR